MHNSAIDINLTIGFATMKLIQHLERKLSWRKKQSGVQNATAKSEKANRKAKKFANASIKVNDNEFSQYIRFTSPLRTVPTTSVPTYEIVNIRTRSPFQEKVPVTNLCSYQSSSPRCKDELDMHIYDKIGGIRICQPDTPILAGRDKYAGVGPTTVTRGTRRNRIKTNPWCSSPWTNKKTFDSNREIKLHNHYKNIENNYESIDNLDWQAAKENLNSFQTDYYSGSLTKNNCLTENNNINTDYEPSQANHRVGTYLNRHVPHHFAAYPQSPFGQTDTDPFLAVAPSPEFVSQSHQICSEISNYFNPHHSPREQTRGNSRMNVMPSIANESLHSKFDSMETIDLTPDLNDYYGEAMSEWSLHEDLSHQEHQHKTNSSISSVTNSPEQSPTSAKSRKAMETKQNKLIVSKRKRPESIYSSRQLKKVDKLKCQLKEVVHAAILEAKKEDTKKA